MFVHLNVGWMSHPFPLSSFKLTSVEQIETIRSLGLSRLTWNPERSDIEEQDVGVPYKPTAQEGQPGRRGRRRRSARRALARRPGRAHGAERAARDLPNAAAERQFVEACRDLRRTNEKIMTDPARANADAHQLARALLDKMLVEGEPCLRVLGEMSGDRHLSHSLNVTVISLMLARQLQGPGPLLIDLGVGALMHDVGKVALPDRVRLARDDFNAGEAALYRDHVGQGLILGRRMGLSAEAQMVIAQHHEFADGSGFPSALMLPRMSLAARIVALVNRYDNLCNASSPAQSITPHEALSRLFAQCRSKFDETLLSGFIKMMGIYPPRGPVVQLSDERFAMVMTVNAVHPLKPRVLVYDPALAVEDALHLDLEQSPMLGIRRSLKPAQLPARALDYLKPRQRIAYFFDIERAPQEGVREEVPAQLPLLPLPNARAAVLHDSIGGVLATLAAMGEAAWIVDAAQGQVLASNPEAEELIGRGDLEGLDAEDADRGARGPRVLGRRALRRRGDARQRHRTAPARWQHPRRCASHRPVVARRRPCAVPGSRARSNPRAPHRTPSARRPCRNCAPRSRRRPMPSSSPTSTAASAPSIAVSQRRGPSRRRPACQRRARRP